MDVEQRLFRDAASSEERLNRIDEAKFVADVLATLGLSEYVDDVSADAGQAGRTTRPAPPVVRPEGETPRFIPGMRGTVMR